MNFAALLLAGGKSSRMGTDKAALTFSGKPLWQHQLATLQNTAPTETFLSGPQNGPFAQAGFPILEDQLPALGPLSGIVSGLRQTQSPWLLVLAIDLPEIPASFLQSLLNESQTGGLGTVPKDAQWWQPLAAVYSKSILPLAEECLHNTDRSLQHFVRLGIAQGFLQSHAITPEEQPFFRNLNTPSDLQRP